MKLLTIAEQNERAVAMLSKYSTGVECPLCKKEMQYEQPGTLMLSSPPQAEVKCFDCRYSTHIYVTKGY